MIGDGQTDSAPGIFSDLLRFVQVLKREWGAESNRKVPHLFIPGKTAALVPEFAGGGLAFGRNTGMVPAFAMKDLPLSRTAALVPEFAVKDLPIGRTLMRTIYRTLGRRGSQVQKQYLWDTCN